MKPLEPGASREEVLAAVEEYDRLVASLDDPTLMVDVVSCRPHASPRRIDLERQAVAGEEDQSAPGWDSGP